jgi:inner membrane protein involved in colicin E2 resistance
MCGYLSYTACTNTSGNRIILAFLIALLIFSSCLAGSIINENKKAIFALGVLTFVVFVGTMWMCRTNYVIYKERLLKETVSSV